MPHTKETKTTPGPPHDPEFAGLKALLELAGITVDEAVPIFGVSRVSLYLWAKEGRGPRQAIIRRQALAAMKLLKNVIAAGDLPLKADVLHADRPAVLAAVLKRHLSPPKPKAAD